MNFAQHFHRNRFAARWNTDHGLLRRCRLGSAREASREWSQRGALAVALPAVHDLVYCICLWFLSGLRSARTYIQMYVPLSGSLSKRPWRIRNALCFSVFGILPASCLRKELMRDLEAWSMELARHCPEDAAPTPSVLVKASSSESGSMQDWNQCCGILVQCLSGSEKEGSKGPFRVRILTFRTHVT